MTIRTVGLIVNPVAGLGGPAGLKGSDGHGTQELARSRGVIPRAMQRAASALTQLPPGTTVLTASGTMGEDSVRQAGACPVVVYASPDLSTGADTTAAVRALITAGADLVLFAGGDGTARDVSSALPGDRSVPVLGIPAGVKMYSSCFAVSPLAAGRTAVDWISGQEVVVEEREVLDIDEDQVRRGVVDTTLHALVPVPVSRRRTQASKAQNVSTNAELQSVARGVVCAMKPDEQYFLGPGSTMRAVAAEIGVEKTPIGVDVIVNGQLVAADADEATLLRLAGNTPSHAVVTVIGGQGFLLGRGNQQISAAVIKSLAEPRLIVASTSAKLMSLNGPLLVDTGDADVDLELARPVRVIIGQHETAVVAVQASGIE